jgi:hypothetical protein
MLPELYQERCEELKRSLMILQTALTDKAEGNYSKSIPIQWQTTQHFFEHELLSLPPCETAPLFEQVRVEMHKQLRLLGTDLLFLQTAKQIEKQQQRLKMMGDRVQLLLNYCDGLLK